MVGRPAYFVGPWDLDRRLDCVPNDPEDGTVVLVESVSKSLALPFHKKKLVLVLSAMRHFAASLREDGYDVSVVRARSYAAGIAKHVARTAATKVVALRPREWGIEKSLVAADLGCPLDLRDDGGAGGHFLLPRDAFAVWADGRKQLRMDVFYRWMRKRLGLLLDERGKPVGGKWSFDSDNRKPVKDKVPPPLPRYEPDAITQQVMEEVASWDHGWASVEGFAWPVNRGQALDALNRFVAERLETFGDHQDAMLNGEPFMWHACLSPALNLGLLSPEDLVEAAMAAWHAGRAPLNAVEGFIRQVIGWREFIRGVYWLRMPEMRTANRFEADQALPDFFWEPDKTNMRCVSEAVSAVHDHGYAHHIQRLMVLGNFALLARIAPLEISHWFWAGFVDAYEWVELPNVHGMALNADPSFTTKPYAASGAYIHKMSNHCGECAFNVKKRHGKDACPFNALFWDFMVQHREALSTNPRIGVIYRSWDRWEPSEQAAIRASAKDFRAALKPSSHHWRFHDDQG